MIILFEFYESRDLNNTARFAVFCSCGLFLQVILDCEFSMSRALSIRIPV